MVAKSPLPAFLTLVRSLVLTLFGRPLHLERRHCLRRMQVCSVEATLPACPSQCVHHDSLAHSLHMLWTCSAG